MLKKSVVRGGADRPIETIHTHWFRFDFSTRMFFIRRSRARGKSHSVACENQTSDVRRQTSRRVVRFGYGEEDDDDGDDDDDDWGDDDWGGDGGYSECRRGRSRRGGRSRAR